MTDDFEFSLNDAAPPAPLGMFDSGVGGLSVLRALRARLPDTSMLYVGDVAHAPYGDRPADEVTTRSLRIAGWLIEQGAKVIVVACNTATVLAIEALRARWPAQVFIGVEPGVRPAASRSRTRRITVMTTAATAASARLRHLIARHTEDAHVHVLACPSLVDTIERGVLAGPELLAVLEPLCRAIRAENVDTVVLGCTHYPFVAATIRELLGHHMTLIDTAAAIAERAAALTAQEPPLWGQTPRVRVFSTGASRTMQRLLAHCDGLEATTVESLDL